jgi:hypothetical protein
MKLLPFCLNHFENSLSSTTLLSTFRLRKVDSYSGFIIMYESTVAELWNCRPVYNISLTKLALPWRIRHSAPQVVRRGDGGCSTSVKFKSTNRGIHQRRFVYEDCFVARCLLNSGPSKQQNFKHNVVSAILCIPRSSLHKPWTDGCFNDLPGVHKKTLLTPPL